MATHVWRGDVPDVAQVDTCPVGGTVEVGDLFILTINDKSVVVAATSTVLATTAEEIAEAAAESNIPEFQEITWEADGANVIATGPANGKPFDLSVSATEANGDAADSQTFTSSTTTAAQSANSVIAANLDSGSALANDDTFIIQDSSVSLKHDLDHSAVQLDALHILADFSNRAEIGLPLINSDGSSIYFEYRNRYLKVGADLVVIGDGNGQGAGAIRLDLGSGQTLVQVLKTGEPVDQDYGAVQLLATHASNELRVFSGTVDVAMGPGEVATFATITASAGVVRCGTGVTLTAVEANGQATIEVRSAATTLLTQGNGVIRKTGSGAVTAIDVGGGNVEVSAAGTITTLTVRAGKTFDASKLQVAVTITNSTAYAGARILDPNGKITWTNATNCPDGADSVTFVTKKGATVKVA